MLTRSEATSPWRLGSSRKAKFADRQWEDNDLLFDLGMAPLLWVT